MRRHFGSRSLVLPVFVSALCMRTRFVRTKQPDLGRDRLAGASKIEKTSGVWVDAQYAGKGLRSRCCYLATRDRRPDGYQDFTEKITVRPGEKQTIPVKMVKDPRFKMPPVFSEIKLSVTPDRAAVFADGLFVCHVGRFSGAAKSSLDAHGHRRVTISLPG